MRIHSQHITRPRSQTNINIELAVEINKILQKKTASIRENPCQAIPACRTITEDIIGQLCAVSDVKMLSYLAAHNSIRSRHDNERSAGLRNDTQREAEELSDVHCGGSQELLSQKKMQLSREFWNKGGNGHLIYLSPHYCKCHQKADMEMVKDSSQQNSVTRRSSPWGAEDRYEKALKMLNLQEDKSKFPQNQKGSPWHLDQTVLTMEETFWALLRCEKPLWKHPWLPRK